MSDDNVNPKSDTAVETPEQMEEDKPQEKAGRRASQKRSSIAVTLDEGSAMLKEGEVEGRRRTRSSTRGVPPPAPPPTKKEKKSAPGGRGTGSRRGRPKKDADKEEKPADNDEQPDGKDEPAEDEDKLDSVNEAEADKDETTDKEHKPQDNGETDGKNGSNETEDEEKEEVKADKETPGKEVASQNKSETSVATPPAANATAAPEKAFTEEQETKQIATE